MRDEKLLKTEQLLREAAEWEPAQAPPASLTQAALTQALEQQRRTGGGGQSRAPMFLALALGGGMAATSLAAALWAVALPKTTQGRPHPLMRAELVGIRKDPVPVRQVTTPTGPEAAPPPAPERPVARLAAQSPPARRRTLRRKPGRAPSRTARAERALPRAVWDTREVEKRHAGLVGPAVLIQPGPAPSTVYVEPGVVSIPLENPNIACAPVGPPPDEPEAPVPTSPGEPEREPQGDKEAEP